MRGQVRRGQAVKRRRVRGTVRRRMQSETSGGPNQRPRPRARASTSRRRGQDRQV
jgi:hypothetical protein